VCLDDPLAFLNSFHFLIRLRGSRRYAEFSVLARHWHALATAREIEVLGPHRFSLTQHHWQGQLLGFAAFDRREIRRGVAMLATALGSRSSARRVDRQPNARAFPN